MYSRLFGVRLTLYTMVVSTCCCRRKKLKGKRSSNIDGVDVRLGLSVQWSVGVSLFGAVFRFFFSFVCFGFNEKLSFRFFSLCLTSATTTTSVHDSNSRTDRLQRAGELCVCVSTLAYLFVF